MSALILAAFAWQSRAVLHRHVAVHLHNWHTALLPPAAEPLIFLVAFGIGLGSQVPGVPWRGGQVPYLAYVGPGMIAYTAFITAFFQSLYGAFIRMHYQRTWEGQLTTQIELPHVIWGEILWAASQASAYIAALCVFLVVLDLGGWLELQLLALPVAVLLAVIGAVAFASLGLLFCALVPTVEHCNLPVFLVGLPVAFVSSTYFPVSGFHPVIDYALLANPLHHLAEAVRGLLHARSWSLSALCFLLEVMALVSVLVPLTHRLLRRRILGESN